MDRRRVAAVLEEIGLLLELKGENPFKTRAYDNAARTLLGLDRDLAELVRAGELTGVPGIGKAIAEKITTLVTTGELPYLDRLREEVPRGLLEWLKIPGLGTKKALAIHRRLDIETLGELEYACRENRLRDLQGFGETSQRKILRGIERVRSRAGRFLQPLLFGQAEQLLGMVRAAPGVRRAEIAGPLRRRLETGTGVALVASAAEAQPVLEALASDSAAEEVLERSSARCRVRLSAGPTAELTVVPDASFPFAWLHATGSEGHLDALRRRASGRGLRLDEQGLATETGAAVDCGDEPEIYRSLELVYTPPEWREEQDDLRPVERGDPPRLIESGDLRGILHCHSSWSDGSASIREMAEATRELGMRYLAICDHSQSAAYAGGLTVERVRRQHDEIDALNDEYAGGFRVLKGIEVDVLPGGELDFPDDVLAGFELVVASVHSAFHLSEEDQTRRVLHAVRNPHVDVLGHVSGRLLLARDGYPLDLHRVLDAAAECGVAVELNCHPHRLDVDWRGLRYGLPRGMQTAICPDAHSPDGLRDVAYGVGIARKGGATPGQVWNAWPLGKLLAHLDKRGDSA